jgi:putative chitinase
LSQLRNPNAVALATGCRSSDVAPALNPIFDALQPYRLLTPMCAVATLATVAVECDFRCEDEAGTQDYFLRHYENREDLGNCKRGDGYTFRGRGYLQLTGRHNYTMYGQWLGYDLVAYPEIANDPEVAAKILALYLHNAHLQDFCNGATQDWQRVRRCVNGGLNGWARFKGCVDRLIPLSKEAYDEG